MASKSYHHHSAEPAGGDRRPFTQSTQPSKEQFVTFHHYVPEIPERVYNKDKYELQDHRGDEQSQRRDLRLEHLHQNRQLYHHHSHHHHKHQHQHQQQQLLHQHQHQQPLHREYDSGFQLPAGASQVQILAPANSPPSFSQALHVHAQSLEREHSLRSISQDQNDKKTSVPCLREPDDSRSALSSSTSRAPRSSPREGRSSDEDRSQSPERSLSLQRGKRKFSGQHDWTFVKSGTNCLEPHRSTTSKPRTIKEVGRTSNKQRAATACVRCRSRKRKCTGENPCFFCRSDNIACEYHDAASVIIKRKAESDDSMVRQVRDMLQGLIDQNSNKVQHWKPREGICDFASPATFTVPSRPQRTPSAPLEEEHRTGPHHLIGSWPSIAELLRESRVDIGRDYVMQAEERPSLFLSSGDEETDKTGNAQALDARTVSMLYEKYMSHVHIMQPFLDERETLDLVQEFSAWHSTSPRTPFADSGDAASRSPSERRYRIHQSGVLQPRPSRPNCLLGHAVVYLILALGETCMHGDLMVADSSSTSPGRMRNTRSMSPSFDETSSTSRVTIQTSPVDEELCINESPAIRKVPGLVYYAKATELFGSQSDGNDLIHAHIFLLAGLYKGQLARVKESMSWYAMAGRVLRQLLHSHGLQDKDHWTWTGEALEARSQRSITDKHRSLIVRASYSCIQLESDILAELDLPSSGIVSLETMLPMPGAVPGVGNSHDEPVQSGNILFHFTSQVYLRIRLNQIHKQLYGPECEGLSLAETRCILQDHEAIIGKWQKELPAGMFWDLDDSPPTNILHARLRAKYWGARYLINRPFLDYILHLKPQPRLTVDGEASDSHWKPRREAEYHLFRAISEMSEEEVQNGYQTCIKAAEKSTIAFDNVLGRPIVTNIHGTAHAQFGNVLVLCGVYWHPDLCYLVDETNLRHLLSRTISFLNKLAPISPTCQADCLILKQIQRTIFDISC